MLIEKSLGEEHKTGKNAVLREEFLRKYNGNYFGTNDLRNTMFTVYCCRKMYKEDEMSGQSDLKVSELANMVGMKSASVRQLIRKGGFKRLCYRVGGTYRFKRESVDQLRNGTLDESEQVSK